MRLSLVGMSGSGKSFWSGKLSRSGFRRICCDDLIAAGLVAELGTEGGSIAAVGRWMGFPFDLHYREREASYLACEMEVMAQILGELSLNAENREDTVVDTTGSVIYTGQDTLLQLRTHTTVVHLATPLEIQKVMLRTYMKSPRPVLWREVFSKRPEETNEQALARCYPQLLANREQQYKELAHITISYYKHREAGFEVEEFLSEAGFRLAHLLK
jgi:shikimate kinase